MNISASIDKLVASAVAVYKRFPLVLVFSSVVFYLVTSLIYEWNWEGLSGHRKFAIIWGVILAVPLYINIQLVREWLLAKWLWWVSLVLLVVIPANSIYLLWNEIKDETEVYIQLATFIFVHGIVATTSYLRFSNEKGFWQFNSLLLLNFINSSFFTAVITLGILAGFGLINVLFNEFYGRGFGVTFAFIATFFHPLLFLAWLPNSDTWLEKVSNFDLPKFFRTLIVFILIPLSIGYLLILYVYIANALIIGELPQGTIGWTALTFTVASVFALVLVYPYRKNEDQKLVYWFSRLLPFALSPLVLLLWLAIGMRVGDYGFTPSRVLLTLLAIWLTLINVYLYTGKKWGLMPLAGALTLLCVVAIGWPINVKSLSIWSQQSIQRSVLQANNIAEGDTVTVAVYNKLKDVDKEKLIGTNSFLKNSNSSLIRLDTLIPEYYYEFENYTWCYLDFEEPEDLSFLLMNGKTTLIKDEFNLGDEKGFEKELNPNYLITLNKDSRFLELKFGDENTIYKLDTLILKGNNLKNEDNISKVVALKAGNNTVFIVFDYLTVQFELDKKSFKYISVGGKAYLLK